MSQTLHNETADVEAARLHQDEIVFDMVSPLLLDVFPRALDEYLAGGVTAIGVTVFHPNFADQGTLGGIRGIAWALHLVRSNPDRMLLITEADDFQRAKDTGRLGLLLHFQNGTQFNDDLSMVEVFYRLGLRASQLTYNIRNLIGDGCTERIDSGLSRFGISVIREMNRLGMVVDGSHSSTRTTLDAMEVGEAPFIFSHSGCKAVFDHPRNITDEQIRACAETGGVVGVLGLPYFISPEREPKLDHILDHVCHVAETVGVDHIGIGLDYFRGVTPYSTPAEQERFSGPNMYWNEGERRPGPWSYAPEIETPSGMRNLTAGLMRRGFTYEETARIMGGNFLRVFRQVWKPVQ